MRALYKYIGLMGLFCFSILTVHSQEMNKDLENTMQKVSDVLANEQACISLNYLQKTNESNAYSFLAECKMYKKDGWEKVIFKEYETIKTEELYLKADHDAKKLYIIKTDKEEVSEPLFPIPTFNEQLLNAYQIVWDSAISDLSTGKVFFKGLAASSYSALSVQFDPQTYQLNAYSIEYKEATAPGMQSMKIELKYQNCNKEQLNKAFTTKQYYVENNGQVELTAAYSQYQLIKNF